MIVRLRSLGLAALFGVTIAGGAEAQYFRGYYAPGPVIYPPAFIPRAEPVARPGYVLASLSARGYDVIGIVSRRSDVLVVDAISPREERVRLIVDAYDGEILERFGTPAGRGRDDARPQATAPRTGDGATRREVPRDAAGARKTPDKVAELPVPPKRPASAIAAPAATAKPAPTLPRFDDWAPINSVPVAPLE